MNITIQSSTLEGCQLSSVLSKEKGYRVCRKPKISIERDQESVDVFIIESNGSVSNVLTQVRDLRRGFSKAIILIGPSDDVNERIIALEMGVDEYMSFPCHARELVARIRNISKWISRSDNNKLYGDKGIQKFIGWEINHNRRIIKNDLGAVFNLTHKEYLLLSVLLGNVNQIVTRDFLLKEVYKRDWSPSDRAVDILVGRLRKKLEFNGDDRSLINTVYGIGYMFSLDG